jgi:hypothetical protein
MRLNWLRSSRVEDRFETWIAQRHQERVLAGETIPAGPHPDQPFLRDVACRSKRISLSDPRVDHAASCPICMSQLLALRQAYRSRHQRLGFASALTVCALVVVATLIGYRALHRSSVTASTAIVSQTVNLWDVGTIRGEQPRELQSVPVLAAPVRLKIILPRFSPAGRYAVAVTRDQTGTRVLAQATADTMTEGQQETLSVNLDLHRAVAGKYFLATTHEQDQAAYYYPLQIK